ncbi:MAG: hypothetical protein LBD42_01900 [Desulfovibrio sp.]|jgi:hypothetical protein|nr:hypothetical protein [Desulfovibrio sp.]
MKSSRLYYSAGQQKTVKVAVFELKFLLFSVEDAGREQRGDERPGRQWTEKKKSVLSVMEARGWRMAKLIRDWMEKFSVGSFLVGIYQSGTNQNATIACVLGTLALAVALGLAKRGVK